MSFDGYAADVLEIARVQRDDNVIANVEMATMEWIEENSDDPVYYFVAMPDKAGHLGFRQCKYDPDKELFEQPAPLGPFEPEP